MIEVEMHGTNFITLRGDSLTGNSLSRSMIALHKSGWSIDACLRCGREVVEKLGYNQVIPKLRELLAEHHSDEDINERELYDYMGLIGRRDWP